MADINKRFVLFKTRQAFNTAKSTLSNESIVFIEDEQRIWAQGKFYGKGKAFSQYKVGAGDDAQTYSANDEAESIINFLAGEGLVITGDNTGKITYSHAESSFTNVTTGAGEFIKSITFDKFGHIAEVEKAKVAQNSYTNVVSGTADGKVGTEAALENGNVHINSIEHDAVANSDAVKSSIKIQGKDNVSVTATAAGVIEVAHNTLAVATGETITPTGDTTSVISSIEYDSYGHLNKITKANLPTKSYVDSKLGAAVEAALILKGVLNSAEDLPETSTVGHTYKVATEGTYAGEMCRPGDVVICVATGDNGTNPEWVAIQSNVDLATDDVVGLVKGGYTTDVANREFAVQIDENGSMFVEVPYKDYNQTSKNEISSITGGVQLDHYEDDKVTSTHTIKGSGSTEVTADADGNITINSTYSDTTYSFAKTETAHSKVLTITTIVDGVAQENPVSIEFDTWAYPENVQA